nr:MAG TPA: hypothetical protein [Caudoviricetes sp.]
MHYLRRPYTIQPHKQKIKHYEKVPYPILAIGCRSIRQQGYIDTLIV